LMNHNILGLIAGRELKDGVNAAFPETGLHFQPNLSEARPGVVSLEDAARIADDFVLLCTTRQSARDFLQLFDFHALARRFALLDAERLVLIVRANVLEKRDPAILIFLDEHLKRRLELYVDSSKGF